MKYNANDLFQLQTNLIDAKVDMATTHAIDRVLDRIDGLRNDMDKRFTTIEKDMDKRFTSLEKDIVAVKTRLGMNEETQGLVREHMMNYAFKTGWIFITAIIASGSSLLATYWPTIKTYF